MCNKSWYKTWYKRHYCWNDRKNNISILTVGFSALTFSMYRTSGQKEGNDQMRNEEGNIAKKKFWMF